MLGCMWSVAHSRFWLKPAAAFCYFSGLQYPFFLPRACCFHPWKETWWLAVFLCRGSFRRRSDGRLTYFLSFIPAMLLNPHLTIDFFMPSSIAFSSLFSLSSLFILAVNLDWRTFLGGLGIGVRWAGERWNGLKDSSCSSCDGGVMSKMAARSFFFFLFLVFVFFHSSRSFALFCFGRLVMFRGWISPLAFFSWYLTAFTCFLHECSS